MQDLKNSAASYRTRVCLGSQIMYEALFRLCLDVGFAEGFVKGKEMECTSKNLDMFKYLFSFPSINPTTNPRSKQPYLFLCLFTSERWSSVIGARLTQITC